MKNMSVCDLSVDNGRLCRLLTLSYMLVLNARSWNILLNLNLQLLNVTSYCMPVQKAVIHCLCVGCFLQSRAHLIAMTLS